MPPRDGNDVGCNKIPAARGNGMQLDRYLRLSKVIVIPSEARDPGSWTGLHSRLAPRPRQRLQFILIDLDLARLLHLIAEAGYEQRENLLLLALQQRLPDLVALGGEVRV